MVSSAGDTPFTLRFARHLCADPNPAGPGYREVTMPTSLDGEHPGLAQPAKLGSYGHATGLPIDPAQGLALSATIWPTLPNERQGVLSLSGQGASIMLGLDAGGAFAELALPDGRIARASTALPMLTRRWYDIAATLGPDGTLTVTQHPRHPLGTIRDTGEAHAPAAILPSGLYDVHLAALPGREGHYNGKLERPAIHQGADLHARWDFSRDIDSNTATDTGPHARHAQLHNLPTRAMTGAAWTGAVHDWKSAPDQYGAIHFHDDDQGDLGWQPSADAHRSGRLALRHLQRPHRQRRMARTASPSSSAPSSATADSRRCLVPTYTYQVYGCYVRPGRSAEIRDARGTAWGALAEDAGPEPAIRPLHLQRPPRRIGRRHGQHAPAHAGHPPPPDEPDGPGAARLGHRPALRRQLHRRLARPA